MYNIYQKLTNDIFNKEYILNLLVINIINMDLTLRLLNMSVYLLNSYKTYALFFKVMSFVVFYYYF